MPEAGTELNPRDVLVTEFHRLTEIGTAAHQVKARVAFETARAAQHTLAELYGLLTGGMDITRRPRPEVANLTAMELAQRVSAVQTDNPTAIERIETFRSQMARLDGVDLTPHRCTACGQVVPKQ